MKCTIVCTGMLFLMLVSSVLAQDLPVTFNPNMLAHSQGLPNEFLLFSADTAVQVLFNPARGGLTNRRFAYLNYLPGSGIPLMTIGNRSSHYPTGDIYSYNGPSVSGSVLFDAGSGACLLQVSNWSMRSDQGYNSSDQCLQQYTGSTIPTYQTTSYASGSPSSASVTAAKFSWIDSDAGRATAIGWAA